MIKEGYKDTEIGVIPVEWEVVELGDFCDILDNKRVPLSSEQRATIKGNIPYYGANGVVDYINDFLFDEELVLLAEDGGNFSEYETRPIAYMINGKSWINNHTHILRAKNNQNHYLFYNLVHKNIMAFINGGTRAKLNRGELVKIKIPLPPLKEQQKIANILSTADEKIEAIASQIEKAEMLKKGLLQKLLSEGIGHSEFKDSELGRIPLGWEVVELDNVAKLNKQKYTPIQSEKLHYIGLEHINQEQGTINGIGYSNDTLSQKNCFNKGEILFGKLRPYLRKFYLADIDGVCSTEILVIKAKDNILNLILFQIITTESFIEHSISKVFGTKMPRTSWAILKEFKLALPPLKEQKQIAQILSKSDEKLEVLRAKKEKYETLKKGLLQKLLSGEIRV